MEFAQQIIMFLTRVGIKGRKTMRHNPFPQTTEFKDESAFIVKTTVQREICTHRGMGCGIQGRAHACMQRPWVQSLAPREKRKNMYL